MWFLWIDRVALVVDHIEEGLPKVVIHPDTDGIAGTLAGIGDIGRYQYGGRAERGPQREVGIAKPAPLEGRQLEQRVHDLVDHIGLR